MLGEEAELLPPTHTDHLERCTRAEGGGGRLPRGFWKQWTALTTPGGWLGEQFKMCPKLSQTLSLGCV